MLGDLITNTNNLSYARGLVMVQIKTDYSSAPSSRLTTTYKKTPLDIDTKPSNPKDSVSFSKESENALLKQMLIEKEKNSLYEKENQLNAKEKFFTERLNEKEKMLTDQIHVRENALAEKTTLSEQYLNEKRDTLRKEKENLEKEKKDQTQRSGLSQIFSGIKKIFFPNS